MLMANYTHETKVSHAQIQSMLCALDSSTF